MKSFLVVTNLFFGLVICFTFASCGPLPSQDPLKASHVMYQWYDDGGQGKVSVSIDLGDQIATIKRGDREIGWSYVATGLEGRNTPAGTFRITEKIVDKYSNRYGWIENEFGQVVNGDATPKDPVGPGERYMPAPMPYWMRLTDWGIGMHVGKIPQPGEPASHGCIRMPKNFVPTLFYMVDVGTQVKIRY
ncbi:MAG: L,D-transpeptidase family protein [Akkermansiaceae bacterium]